MRPLDFTELLRLLRYQLAWRVSFSPRWLMPKRRDPRHTTLNTVAEWSGMDVLTIRKMFVASTHTPTFDQCDRLMGALGIDALDLLQKTLAKRNTTVQNSSLEAHLSEIMDAADKLMRGLHPMPERKKTRIRTLCGRIQQNVEAVAALYNLGSKDFEKKSVEGIDSSRD